MKQLPAGGGGVAAKEKAKSCSRSDAGYVYGLPCISKVLGPSNARAWQHPRPINGPLGGTMSAAKWPRFRSAQEHGRAWEVELGLAGGVVRF
jgi:hypothetical protein